MKPAIFAVCSLALLCLALFFALTASAAGLELTIVTASEQGPVIEPISGCYVYGQFIGAVAREKQNGRALSNQLAGIEDIAESKQYTVRGIKECLISSVQRVHASAAVDWKIAEVTARTLCREAGGRTWEF